MSAWGANVADRIKEGADIVEVVSDYVVLRAQGTRYVGLCPFHNEWTPSFGVDRDSGLYFCPTCKASGDVVRFVEQIEGVDFQAALDLLAARMPGLAESADHWGRVCFHRKPATHLTQEAIP